MNWIFLIVSFTLVGLKFGAVSAVYRNHINSVNSGQNSHLTEGQRAFNHQLFRAPMHPDGPGNGLGTPIATNIGFFPDVPGRTHMDYCGRDTVKVEDGTCQTLMTQGNCGAYEETILDFETGRGTCVQRLCPPDRIFIHSTQLCHDPHDPDVCPAGRELFYSSYGTAACACPDGTVQTGSSTYHDVCAEILRPSEMCSHYGNNNLVQWFPNFNSRTQCLPDPCGEMNGNTSYSRNELPFIPSISGQCFRWGQSNGLCAKGNYFALSLSTLTGTCTLLENSGYEIFDEKSLKFNIQEYGPLIDRTPQTSPTHYGSTFENQIDSGNSNGYQNNPPRKHNYKSTANSSEPFGKRLGRNFGLANQPIEARLSYHSTLLSSGHEIVHPIIMLNSRKGRSAAKGGNEREAESKRTGQSYFKRFSPSMDEEGGGDPKVEEGVIDHKVRVKKQASPSSVFETRLLGCSPGRQRDLNAKCRDVILPAKVLKRRGTRASPPVSPTPTCSGSWNIQRKCVPKPSARRSVAASNLG